MPELPDIELYLYALRPLILERPFEGVRIASAFRPRSVERPVVALSGRKVQPLRRIGKRLVFGFEGDYFAVLHLMIAGRLWWKPPGAALRGRRDLAAFDFATGTLVLTEAGTKHRASLHIARGVDALAAHDPAGGEPLLASPDAVRAALTPEDHPLTRALTEPRPF